MEAPEKHSLGSRGLFLTLLLPCTKKGPLEEKKKAFDKN